MTTLQRVRLLMWRRMYSVLHEEVGDVYSRWQPQLEFFFTGDQSFRRVRQHRAQIQVEIP